MRPTPRQLVATVLACTLLIGGGATMAIAAEGGSGDGVNQIGKQEISIEDASVTIEDTHVTGPGLPDKSIDQRTYAVEESTTTIEGLTVTVNGETYEICRITVHVDDVGVTVENVSLSSGN